MPDSTIDRLFIMLEAQAILASKERKELVEAFERQISGLRLEVRGIAVIVAIVALAFGGTAINLKAPGVVVTTTPDAAVVTVLPVDVAPVDAAPVETPTDVASEE
jgi:hypothetical protein